MSEKSTELLNELKSLAISVEEKRASGELFADELNDILDKLTKYEPELQAVDKTDLPEVSQPEVDLPIIDTGRFTDNTTLVLAVDSLEGQQVVCVDLWYDSPERLPTGDMECIFEEPLSEANILAAHLLANAVSKQYDIPALYDQELSQHIEQLIQSRQTKTGYPQSEISQESALAELESTEKIVYKLLEKAATGNGMELDVENPHYKSAYSLTAEYCMHRFPELHEMVFEGDGSEDLFFESGGWEGNLFYYNPDSNAGGQIVHCPLNAEQASRMIGNDDYIDVLAENTQYLSDINTYHFFNTTFGLLSDYINGDYLGNDKDKVCADIVAKSKDSHVSLDDVLAAAKNKMRPAQQAGKEPEHSI